MENVESQLESIKLRRRRTKITRGNNSIRVEELEYKLKGLLERVEKLEAGKKQARGEAHSYSCHPQSHSKGL